MEAVAQFSKDTIAAYKEWNAADPVQVCTYTCTHYVVEQNGRLEPKPDDKVCERERSWRKYVRLRNRDLGITVQLVEKE